MSSPAFFVPGHTDTAAQDAQEQEYQRLRGAVRQLTQREPRARRIFSVGCRYAGRDCVIEVGGPHPVEGDPVAAIIDVGGDTPYHVCTGGPDEAPLPLGKRVYTVTEFA
jgi:hypothetical protein